MKINKVAALFKRNKRLTIYNVGKGEQWIGNGEAIYSMSGLPRMTKEALLKIFDVPPEKQAGWLGEETGMPPVDISSETDNEIAIEPMKASVNWLGDAYWFFPDGRNLYTVKEDYIKPLLDEPEYITYHKRETINGGFVLAVKIGLELKALIMPMFLHRADQYLLDIQNIAALYRTSDFEGMEYGAEDCGGYADPEASEAESGLKQEEL